MVFLFWKEMHSAEVTVDHFVRNFFYIIRIELKFVGLESWLRLQERESWMTDLIAAVSKMLQQNRASTISALP